MSTLSPRGTELANGPSIRDVFEAVAGDDYDANTNSTGFVNLGIAENHTMLPEVADYVSKHPPHFTPQDFSYGVGPWGTKRMRAAMARHMNKALKPVVEIRERDVLLTNGVTAACDVLGFGIADPGDGVLMGRPLYQGFVPDFGTVAKVKTVHVSFGNADQFSPEAAACYEKALQQSDKEGIKVRALLLCNPHNPLGQCYPRDTIIALMKLCNKYKIHLLSDEIYAKSVFEVQDNQAVPFQSALSFDSSQYIDREYLHVMYGMSKDFAAAGIRIGCIYTRNEELWRAISAMSQFHWSGIGNERIAIGILEDEAWQNGFFKTSEERLAKHNKLVRDMFDSKGVNYHKGGNAGFFVWADLRPYLKATAKEGWDAEDALSEKLMQEKVYITPGKMLTSEEPGWFRVIFSLEEKAIKEGLKRIFKVIGV